MDMSIASAWKPADFCMRVPELEPDQALVSTVYTRVCRTDFSAPGFCLLDLGANMTSVGLRQFMLSLKRSMQKIHRHERGRDLVLMSAARFDQQVTTKLHRDGGPDESFLLLGYEPTEIPAKLAMADYAHCAWSMGLTPAELLENHNPMFGPGEELLRPFTTQVECFSRRHFQVVLINNSIATCDQSNAAWQGVLHMASVQEPSDQLRRVVNSTMIASVPMGSEEPVSIAAQEEFLCTSAVRRRGYDKPQVEDDR